MSLDPYRDWLQIQDSTRPLSHYALLGLKPSEQDAGQIQAAYARSMGVVRKYQVGAHMEVAQRVISELSEAYATLTHPQKRQAYDAARLPSREQSTAPHVATPSRQPEVEPSSLRLQDAEPPVAASETPEPPQPRGRKKQPPATVASYAVVVAALVALLFWVLEDDSPPVVPMGPTGARAVVKPSFPGAQPAARHAPMAVGTLDHCLIDAPPDGSPANFSAIVQDIGEGGITVVAHAGDNRGVRVMFADAPRELFQQLQYRPGARVQVMGTVVSDPSLDPPWRVRGSFMVRLDEPPSPINAAVIGRARRATTPSGLPSPTTQPSAASPDAVPVPKLSPWDQQLSDSQDAWSKLRDIKPGDRLMLSAAFDKYVTRPRSPAELWVRFRIIPIRIKGPFLPAGEMFLKRLQADDRLDLEVTVVDPSRSEVELNWIARAGAASGERVICRPASTISLAQTIDVRTTRPINGLAWSPDGSQLIVVAQPVTLWDISTGALFSTLNNQECLRATWSSDGSHIALVEDDQDRIVICDPAGKMATVLPTRADNGALVASNPKQPQMVLVVKNPNSTMSVGLMNFASKPASQDLGAFTGTPRVAWSSDGTRLALAARDASGFRGIRVLKLNSKNLLAKVQDVAFADTVDDLQWVPGSDLLAVYASRELTVADPLNANRRPLKIENIFDSRKYALSADGRFAAAVVSGRGVQVWSLEDVGAPQWEEDTVRLDSVAWSPVRQHLAAMEASGTIWIWNESGRRLTRIQTGIFSVRQTGLAFSPDGSRLATFGPNSVLIYDVSQAEAE